MSDNAEQLMERLRNEFGNIPRWKSAFTQECLDKGDSEWSITLKYHELAHTYYKFRPLARAVHRRCKKQIGKFPDITEDTIKGWLVKNMTDAEMIAEYEKQFNEAQMEKHKAKKLLAGLRRDSGDCRTVGELHVLRWLQRNLTQGKIKSKYEWYIEQAGKINRAEALRYRLEDDVSRKLVVSNAELLKHLEDLKEDEIVDYYRKKIPNQGDNDALAADQLSADGDPSYSEEMNVSF